LHFKNIFLYLYRSKVELKIYTKMQIIDRQIEKVILSLSRQYPAITITGPRQSGKTTLAKKLFPQKKYINLENPDQRELALSDPRTFLEKIKNGAILDEIQRAPEILSYLQEIIDSESKKGVYILTGSNQFSLLNNITQSLAGRTVLLKLLPFSIAEIKNHIKNFNTDNLIFYGFYPRIYKEQLNPTIAYRSYYETYIERDLRQLIHVKDINQFQRFVKLCAGRIGQLINSSHLSNEIGVSVPTIKSWLSILEASYIIMLLQPYYENINKRLIKSPKLYFYDVGLATYLLGIENPNQLSRDPLWGALFENMVLMDLVKARYNKALDHQLYFFRDSHQNEIDIVFKHGASLIPIEIKSARTFTPDFLKGLEYFQNLFPGRIEKGFLVYNGKIEQEVRGFELINFHKIADRLLEISAVG